MNFLELLKPQGDKANLNELIFAKNHLSKDVQNAIPNCMYNGEDGLNEEVFLVLSWVIARRENPDITKEEVGNLVGNAESDAMSSINKEILYFFSTETREDIEERFAEAKAAREAEQGGGVEKQVENPTLTP